MKLKLPSQEIEASAPFVTEEFDIGDKAIIMDILRGKMYSNPIHTIAQEIMSNARDAHREAGCPERPIVITVPSVTNQSFKIRDFGPGITPDRMANVFIKYGNSTKRDDDIETGGFGLGAKSPFSYTDMFTVISITPDETGQQIRREYIAYIDESRVGAMSLVKEDPTDEEQGTTIIVTSKEGDYYKFEEAVRAVGRYWEVKPIVEPYGTTFNWKSPTIKYEGGKLRDGPRWQMTENPQPPIITVDRIPYSLDKHALFGLPSTGWASAPRGYENEWRILEAGFIAHVDLPEAVVTANREKIEWTEEVRERVRGILKDCLETIKVEALKDINRAENIAVAAKHYREMRKCYPIEHAKWNGIDLLQFVNRDPNMREYADVHVYAPENEEARKLGRVTKVRKSKRDYYNEYSKIPTDPRIAIVEDDCGTTTPSTPRIATLLSWYDDDNEEYVFDKIFVVKFKTESEKDDDGNMKVISKAKEAEEKLKWSKFEVIKLSAIPKKKRVIVRSGNSGIPVTISPVKVLDPRVGNKRWVPVDDADLKNGEGVYLVMSRNAVEFCGKKADADKLRYLADLSDVPIHSVLKRYVKRLGPGWKTLEQYFEEEIVRLSGEVTYQAGSWEFAQDKISCAYQAMKDSLDQLAVDSPLVKWIKLSELAKTSSGKMAKLERISKQLGKKCEFKVDSTTIPALRKTAEERYPLLFRVRVTYKNEINSALRDDLVMYVNEKDEMAVRATWALVPVSKPASTEETQ